MLAIRIPAILGAMPAVLALSACSASIDPHGLFFHSFTGSATGSEWATWGSLGDPDRYEFSDLRSAGAYPATFAPDDSFALDSGQGTGSFSGPGSATIDFTLSGGTHFHSVLSRAPYTDADFPVFLSQSVAGNPLLAGTWNAVVKSVDPATGATQSTASSTFEVTVAGSTVRFKAPDGKFYQGAWLSTTQAGFRVIDRTPSDPKYRTFPGSATSVNQNLLGELRVSGPGEMALTLFFETRKAFPLQTQTMQRIELTRAPAPSAPGAAMVAGVLALRRRARSGV